MTDYTFGRALDSIIADLVIGAIGIIIIYLNYRKKPTIISKTSFSANNSSGIIQQKDVTIEQQTINLNSVKNESYKRNIILDYIQTVLWPISKQLESEILDIELNNFYWYQRNGKSELNYISKLSNIRTGEGFSKNDVFRKHSDLENLLSDRDLLLEELIGVFEKIKETLEGTIQISCLQNLIEQSNRDQKEELKLKEDVTNDPIKHFMPYLINYGSNKEYPRDGRTDIFLKKYGNKIFFNCFVERTKLKELHEAKESKSNQLTIQNRKTLERIQQIIVDYRKEYYFSENEIEPPHKT